MKTLNQLARTINSHIRKVSVSLATIAFAMADAADLIKEKNADLPASNRMRVEDWSKENFDLSRSYTFKLIKFGREFAGSKPELLEKVSAKVLVQLASMKLETIAETKVVIAEGAERLAEAADEKETAEIVADVAQEITEIVEEVEAQREAAATPTLKPSSSKDEAKALRAELKKLRAELEKAKAVPMLLQFKSENPRVVLGVEEDSTTREIKTASRLLKSVYAGSKDALQVIDNALNALI